MAALIREYTEPKEQLSLAEKAMKGDKKDMPMLFGNIHKYIDLPKNFEEFSHMTLAQVAAIEWAGIERVLRLALGPPILALPAPPTGN
jgi:hypothetical protein